MILSHRHRFVFIKTRKTAGTSIEVFLSQHCGPDDVVTPIAPHVEPHRPRNHAGFYNHIPAADVRAAVGAAVWDGYFTFCVERDPWDKSLSFYHMLNHQHGGRYPFADYLRPENLPVDHPRYTDPADPGRVIVDRVLRYERLNEELADVFGRFGIPFTGDLGVRAKSEYRTDRRPPRDVYTAAEADVVREAFAREIELFGYRWECPPAAGAL